MNLNRSKVTFVRIFEDSHHPVRTTTWARYRWCMYFSKPSINSCTFVTTPKKSIDGYSFETLIYWAIRFLPDFLYFIIKTGYNNSPMTVLATLFTFLNFISSSKDVSSI